MGVSLHMSLLICYSRPRRHPRRRRQLPAATRPGSDCDGDDGDD